MFFFVFFFKSHPELNFILWREPVMFPGAVSQLPSQQKPVPGNGVLNDFPGVWNAINMIRASGHAIATAACRHTHRPQEHSFPPSGQKMTGVSPSGCGTLPSEMWNVKCCTPHCATLPSTQGCGILQCQPWHCSQHTQGEAEGQDTQPGSELEWECEACP